MIDKIQEIALAVVGVILMMAPYLLLGFAIAGVLSLFFTPAWVSRNLGRRGLWQVVKAALIGVPLPLCSCGVLPLAFALRKSGAGKGATVSFLASTPQTGVDSIFLTYSLLGPVIAFLRIIAAFVSGIVAGLLTDWVCLNESTDSVMPAPPVPDSCCCEKGVCTGDETSERIVWSRESWEYAFRQGFVVLPRDMARPLLAGVLVAGLVSALVPEGLLATYIPPGPMGYLLALLIGIPMYVCSASSVPIAALLIQAGVSPGAAMVFMIAGPATNSAAVITLWREIGHRGTLAYLAAISGVAILFGFILDGFLTVVITSAPILHHHVASEAAHVPVLQWVSAIILLIILIPGLFTLQEKTTQHMEI
ncbi:MAG: SO_0444 family Cu/Zn efflux transporter [bacterium]